MISVKKLLGDPTQAKQAGPQKDHPSSDSAEDPHPTAVREHVTAQGKPPKGDQNEPAKTKGDVIRGFLAIHKPVLEFIGLVALVIYTAIAALQWKAMKDQLIYSEKAFLSVQDVFVTDGGDDGVSLIAINFHNSGSTPARKTMVRNIKVSVNPTLGTPARGEWPLVKQQDDYFMGLIAPQASPAYITPIKPPMMQSLRDNSIVIAISGDIEYTDIFGKSHVTKFCEANAMTQNEDGKPKKWYFSTCDKRSCDDESCTAN